MDHDLWPADPAHIDFGAVEVGSVSDYVTGTYVPGEYEGSLYASHDVGVEFGTWSPCSVGVTCTFELRFAPTSRGRISGEAWAQMSDGHRRMVVTWEGVGVGVGEALELTPDPVHFGEVGVGGVSEPQEFLLTNVGDLRVDVTNVTIARPFVLVPGDRCAAGVRLEPGASCTVRMVFEPSSGGTETDQLVISTLRDTIVEATVSGFGAVQSATLTPSFDFGAVAFDSTATGSVTLENTGNVDLSTTSMSAGTGFSATSGCVPGVVAPGDSCDISMVFAPQAAGSNHATLTVDTEIGPLKSELFGVGLPLQLDPQSADVGDVTVGHRSPPTSFVVTNLASDEVPVTVQPAATPFTQVDDCPDVLPGGGTCTITVEFSPTVVGQERQTLSVLTPADGSLQTLTAAVTGNGVAPALGAQPAELDLGTHPVGATTGAPVTMTNNGGAPLVLTSLAAAEPFAVGDPGPCMTTLAPGDSCDVEVTFTPTDPGPAAADLTIVHPGGETTVPLDGFGATAGIAVAPEALDFGGWLPGATSPPESVTVTNTANVPVVYEPATVTGPFEIVRDDCAGSIATGATCTIDVRYTPAETASGTEVGRVELVGEGVGGAVMAAADLTGFAIVADLQSDPADVDFGEIVIGDPAATQPITVTNTGNVPLNIEDVTINGTMAAAARLAAIAPDDFEVDGAGCIGLTLAPGEPCTVEVRYVPEEVGTSHAAASFVTDNGRFDVGLAGSAVAPPPPTTEPPPTTNPPTTTVPPPTTNPPTTDPSPTTTGPATTESSPTTQAPPNDPTTTAPDQPESPSPTLPVTGGDTTGYVVWLAVVVTLAGCAVLLFAVGCDRRRRETGSDDLA